MLYIPSLIRITYHVPSLLIIVVKEPVYIYQRNVLTILLFSEEKHLQIDILFYKL
jgi:hypothetical protein